MMSKLKFIRLAALALCLACPLAAHAQAPIAYQGELRLEGQPFNGTVDIRFELWNSSGSLLESDRLGSQLKTGVQVDNGLFQVDDLVLGTTSVWRDPQNRWLQVIAHPGGPNEQPLWPRQRILPTPMAWVARRGVMGDTEGFWSVLNSNGASIFRVYNNSRVSIGNQVPRQHLSIGSRLDLYSGNANSPTVPSIRGSGADNLVLNAHGGGATFINHDSGSGGVRFHNGTSGGEIMRIQPVGASDVRVGIRTNNPQSSLHVNGTVRANAFITNTFTASGGVDLCRSPGGSGQAQGLIGDCPSSKRFKEDIVAIEHPAALLAALRPVRFTWTENGQPDLGLIAEEVADVIPELAFRDDNGEIQSVNYRHLTAVLVAGWQAQQGDLVAQRSIIATQQDEILALRAELAAEREATAARLATLESLLLDGSAMARMNH